MMRKASELSELGPAGSAKAPELNLNGKDIFLETPFQRTKHLICFKQWTSDMVSEIINSAINLKSSCKDTHNKRLDICKDVKVTILQEKNRPILNMAVSKAATFLGAYDVNIVDNFSWEHDYYGRIFSSMSDVIFVSTTTHLCVQRFANQSTVPVLCMMSRTHASILALSTIMAIIEEFGSMKCLNVSYVGSSHPVLNSYLLLCPMLGANIRFICCCQDRPVSPLLYKASEEMALNKTHTIVKSCSSNSDALFHASVVIAGPTSTSKETLKHFQLSPNIIEQYTQCPWIFFHTCPRGEEVDDTLFYHDNARTFNAFENMQYIASALLANAIKGFLF